MCSGTGYHRLWGHRAYTACQSLKYALAFLATAAVQKDIIWWVRHHRAHHRYLDTPQDPYDASKGFLWSHIGWVLTVHDRPNWGSVDIQDVKNDPVARWQRRYFFPLALFWVVVAPPAIAHLGWNDWAGGLFFGGFLRCVLVWHCTFLTNSAAHWMGDQPYSDSNTSRQLVSVALVTLGEGYHNFHHEFPSDYRNGPQTHDLDLSKWVITLWERLGWATALHRTSAREIDACRDRQARKRLGLPAKNPAPSLPTLSWEQYRAMVQQGTCLTAIAGVLYDVGEFVASHPGGETLLRQAVGTDATASFHGGLYRHSSHAHHLLQEMSVAVLSEDDARKKMA